LEELTRGVELVFASVCEARTVCVRLADSPRVLCSSRVRCVLACLRFRSVEFSSFGWTKFRTVRSRGADSPRAGGQSASTPRTGSVAYFGQSAAQGRTVRRTCADNPPYLAGQSASGRQGWFFDRLLFDCFRFLSLGFLIASLGLVEPCLGLWLHVWIRCSCDWGIGRIQPRGRIFIGSHSLPPLWSPSDPSKSEPKHLRMKRTRSIQKSNENSSKKTRKSHEQQEGNHRNHQCFHTLRGQILYKTVKKIYTYGARK
jgi:hypothetical protein